MRKTIHHKLIKYVIGLLVVILIEVVLSNNLFFLMCIKTGRETLDCSSLPNNGSIEIDLERPIDTYYIELEYYSSLNAYVTGTISVKDDGCKYAWERVDSFSFSTNSDGENIIVSIPICSRGKMSAVSIALDSGVPWDLKLNSIGINTRGFTINYTRLLVFIILYALFVIIVDRKLNEVDFEYYNKIHIFSFCCVLILNCLIALFILKGTTIVGTEDIKYPLEKTYGEYDNNVRTFDAFKKGQLYLESDIPIENNQMLDALENKYDPSSREGIQYYYDYVYYNGHYYRYFGVSPVLTYYYPYYFIHKTLPNMNQAAFFYALIFILFIEASLFLTIIVFKIKTPVLAVWLMALLLPSASTLYMLQSCADMYYVPFVSAYAFVAVFIFFSLLGYYKKSDKQALVWFLIAGLSIPLIVESRPLTFIPAFLLMLPLYVSVLVDKEINCKHKIFSVVSFATPILLGAACIMWYNWARFGNPLEFGEKYQLTVLDVSKNKLVITTSSIASFITNYFFKRFNIIERFPFIQYPEYVVANEGRWLFSGKLFYGVLAIPSNYLLFLLPWIKNSKSMLKKAMLITGITGSIIALYIDYSIGGLEVRYPSDAMLVMTILVCVILVEMVGEEKIQKKYLPLIYLIIIVSIIIGYLMIFKNERDFIRWYAPNKYALVERFFRID